MDDWTRAALGGYLSSPAWGQDGGKHLYLANNLPVPLYVYGIDESGRQNICLSLNGDGTPILFASGATTEFIIYYESYFVIRTAFSGAFVALMYINPNNVPGTIIVDSTCLLPPNQIGHFPEACEEMPLPPDQPRVLVGVGQTATDPPSVILREQFWQRGGDSYVLAAGSTRTVSTTLQSGMQDTSSHQDMVAQSLGLSSSFGWGPISASLSANLSASSSSFQQITVSSQATQFESLTLTNTGTTSLMFLRWQLMDVVTVFQTVDPSTAPAAETPSFPPPANGPGGMTPVTCVALAQSPGLISRPYDMATLPARPANPEPPTDTIIPG